MYLEEVILDGFKSYATRTVVGPFHKRFNAISGLNGTGKSNVLDAICFVMGIKSLQQMRVAKLEELIYKQGQAGITKASVTLVFRNEDRHLSPIGLADHPKITVSRQIVVGGRDRFVLNGHTAAPSHIQTVFQSVQLNVNNPHFLVMQGRITKVINMKPPELLTMIEEAAGTRMYETKRAESMRKILTKETQLQEIESVLKEEIEPTLTALREEQENYAASLRAAAEIGRLERFCRAYELYKVMRDITALRPQHDRVADEVAALKREVEEKKREQQTIEIQLSREEAKTRQQGQEERQRLADLTKKLRELDNEEIVKKVALAEAEKAQAKLVADITQLEATLKGEMEKRERRMAATRTDREAFEEHEAVVTRLRAERDDLTARLEEVRTGHVGGVRAGEGGGQCGQTLRQRLTAKELELSRAETEAQQLELLIKQATEEGSATDDSATRDLRKHMEEGAARLSRLTKDYESSEREHGAWKAAEAEKRKIEGALALLEDELMTLRRKTHAVHQFRSEAAQSELTGIEGLAVELFKIRDDCLDYALALEEAGKSKVLNIVVRDDTVGKRVLELFAAKRRVTCIPMNRIRGGVISNEAYERTLRSLGPGSNQKVKRPLDTVLPISDSYSGSLAYVFGSVYLCGSSELASKVSQDPAIRMAAITIEGDSYNPVGSVSGGSTAGLGGLLLHYRRYVECLEEDKALRVKLEQVSREMQSHEAAGKQASQKRAAMESARIAVEGIAKRLEEAGGISAKQQKDLSEAREKLQKLETVDIPRLKQKEIPALQRDVEAATGGSRAEQTAKLEKQLKDLRAQVKKAETSLSAMQQAADAIAKELAVSAEHIEFLKTQLESKRGAEMQVAKAELADAQLACAQTSNALAEVAGRLETAQKAARERSALATQLAQKKHDLEMQIAEAEAEAAKKLHDQRSLRQNLQDREKRASYLVRDHPWLEKIRGELHKDGGEFDFRAPDAEHCFERLEKLRSECDKMQKKVNRNVQTLLRTAESQYENLREKKEHVVRDKKKLEEFILELDQKKREALDSCWRLVDEHFSSIFGLLLPGSKSGLTLTATGDIKDGLEMRVSLAGSKPASLSELSGGQRSLLALSLVLALLKFKPAPLYILDEIDAALDLSHTQNIGKMIRVKFRGSQFLVVSLKENLFRYADVLFRTHFAAGSSQVTRIVNAQGDTDDDDDDEQENRVVAKRKLQPGHVAPKSTRK